MAIYRQVHTDFWNDSKVSDNFTPEDRYFMLFLLTNPYTNMIGCYEISKKNMGFLMGYSIDTVSSLINRFVNIHHVIEYDEQTKEVLIINWNKFNWINNYKLIPKMVSDLKLVKSESFKKTIHSNLNEFFKKEIKIDTVSIPYAYDIDTITHEENKNEKENENKNEKENNNKKIKDVVPDSASVTTKKFVKPSIEDLNQYQKERGSNVSVQGFIDYYDSKGWLVGKAPMKDWKAAFRTWIRNSEEFSKSKIPGKSESPKKGSVDDATAV